jgi:hypothetical protein
MLVELPAFDEGQLLRHSCVLSERPGILMKIGLKLGELRIRLSEAKNRPALYWPQWIFEPFYTDGDDPVDIELEVRVTSQLPEIPHGRMIFDACHGLWKLYEAEAGYYVETRQTHSKRPFNRLLVDKECARGEIWTREQRHYTTGQRGWVPPMVINPVVELCLLTRLAREGGVLMHGAGVVEEGKGWVFTGASGAGKSTISDLYTAHGETVLSDERIIIRKTANRFLLCGTHWHGTSQAVNGQVVPLDRLYVIRHGAGEHRLRKLSSIEMCRLGLQQCFLPHWDREGMTKTVDLFSELADRIECYDLAFLNQPDVIEFLQQPRGAMVTSAAV